MRIRNDQAIKKAYAAPKLVVYGSIHELTKAASGNQPRPTNAPTNNPPPCIHPSC
jgi:hypothetical protein